MIVSWNWLREYLRLDMPVEVLTDRLALSGLNHESTSDVGGDLAIDLEVTSNRPDCLGHLGVAREISVLFDRPLTKPDPRPRASGAPVETMTSVVVEASDLCPRFTARVVSGLTVGESPWWLRKRLETLGVRPISNVVDVTNYVMFECGQPLHAYDLDQLSGRRLIVRRAKAKEQLRAINNKVYDLNPEMLAIADAERPVGLAGVMGGLDSEIGSRTCNVLIEAAQFDAMSVRKTSRALGLFSPSSYRFERPLDPEITEWASRRCAELILETAGGTLHPGVIDVSSQVPPRAPITLRIDQIPRVLGIEIDQQTTKRILLALGLEPLEESTKTLVFRPPTWRSDLEREIDLIEEVARVHGYEHIPENRAVPLTSAPRGRRERVETAVRGALGVSGFDEAVCFSLVSEPLSTPLSTDEPTPPLRIEHSSRREGVLRQSLVPSLLAARAYNEAHGNVDASLFEMADVYLPRPDLELPDQPTRLALVSGRDFLGLKGVIESLLERLHIRERLKARPAIVPLLVPGRTAQLLLGETHLGYIGSVDRVSMETFELRGDCSATELEFTVIQSMADLVPMHHTLPPFPVVSRDLSLVVARGLPWSELALASSTAAGPTLESVEFLDTFQGGDLPQDKHSVHFALRFRHPTRTLTGEEVERSIKAVVEACAARFEATLRA
jgi:phenylalanyl-tRNA synthetase beta chain